MEENCHNYFNYTLGLGKLSTFVKCLRRINYFDHMAVIKEFSFLFSCFSGWAKYVFVKMYTHSISLRRWITQKKSNAKLHALLWSEFVNGLSSCICEAIPDACGYQVRNSMGFVYCGFMNTVVHIGLGKYEVVELHLVWWLDLCLNNWPLSRSKWNAKQAVEQSIWLHLADKKRVQKLFTNCHTLNTTMHGVLVC